MSKLPDVGTTIFTVMSQMAKEYNAINLSQGFPNFNIDPQIELLVKDFATKPVHQYMPMNGSPELLDQLARLINKQYSRTVNPNSELLITAGATQAIFTAIQALINSNDEVIILDPSYDSYAPSVRLAGGRPVHVLLNEDYSPNWDEISNNVGPKTKMIVINSPHNPSGTVWKESDYEKLEQLMYYHPELILLSDEVYEFITFESEHISIHTREKIRSRSIITSSFGKTFHLTGWKMGYLYAPEDLMIEIKKVHQFNVFCVNSLSQAILTEYLKIKDVNELSSFYKEKRDLFRKLLIDTRFELLPCEGTYFQLADYSNISSKNDVDFCRDLTKTYGVAAIPVSVFNKNNTDRKHIRFCFAKDDNTLQKASDLLRKL